MEQAMLARDAVRDFDFLIGDWRVHNRRLVERLQGSTEWVEYEATSVARPVLDGLGNTDEFRTDHDGGSVGMSLRLFDPATQLWSIYWADTRRCVLDPPVVGSFAGDIGIFEGADAVACRPILVRFTWSGVTRARPRWEHAFSDDDGATWETNWVMEFERTHE